MELHVLLTSRAYGGLVTHKCVDGSGYLLLRHIVPNRWLKKWWRIGKCTVGSYTLNLNQYIVIVTQKNEIEIAFCWMTITVFPLKLH